MESVIKYQFGEIEAAAADINATSGRINALLDDLKSGLQPMVASWEGDSATAYNEAQATCQVEGIGVKLILWAISFIVVFPKIPKTRVKLPNARSRRVVNSLNVRG